MSSKETSLIVKHITGEASAKETAEVKALLKHDADFKRTYENYLLYWNNTANFAKDFNPDAKKAFQHIKSKIIESPTAGKNRTLVLRLTAVAASILFMVGLSYLFFINGFFSSRVYQTSNTAEQIILPDSSVVNLNQHSKLIVLRAFNRSKRKVILEGEAFFEIAKNPEIPFIVETGKVETSVLGTSFNIYENEDLNLIELSVYTGMVRFATKSNTIILKKNQTATYFTDEKQISEPSELNINNNAWLTKNLIFEDTPLAEILKTLEHTYRIRFNTQMIKDYDEISFSGRFSNMPYNDVLQIIGLTLSLEFKEQENGVFMVVKDNS